MDFWNLSIKSKISTSNFDFEFRLTYWFRWPNQWNQSRNWLNLAPIFFPRSGQSIVCWSLGESTQISQLTSDCRQSEIATIRLTSKLICWCQRELELDWGQVVSTKSAWDDGDVDSITQVISFWFFLLTSYRKHLYRRHLWIRRSILNKILSVI